MAPVSLLVTGAEGRVGRAVTREARARGHPVRGCGRTELDVTSADAARRKLEEVLPDWVVHCAAFTDVDGAERDPEGARRVNVRGTANVAEAAAGVGAGLAYLSTDYVFDGASSAPYRPEDPVAPLSVYGRTKAEGEEVARRLDRHLVVRTSWVFGQGERGFAATVRRASRRGEALRVVDGERSRPTLDAVLAECLVDFLEREALGTLHAACAGTASRVELARAIVQASGGDVRVTPVGADEFGAEAPRPVYSVLDLERTEEVLGRPTLHWRRAVEVWCGEPHEESR